MDKIRTIEILASRQGLRFTYKPGPLDPAFRVECPKGYIAPYVTDDANSMIAWLKGFASGRAY